MVTIKRGDTRNAISADLFKNGEPADLSECSVLFYMERKINGGYAQIIDGNTVVYPLEKSVVNTSGVFRAEFKAVYPDGRVETYPNDRFITVKIIDDLGVIE